MRHELIDAADEPQDFADFALAFLLNKSYLITFRVPNVVLVDEF